MLIIRETGKSMDRIRADLERACAAHQFGIMGVHDLRAKLIEKGQSFERPCLVFEVCNPAAAKQALEANLSISTALPCRIAVYETKEGRHALATIRPTLLLEMFQTEGLGALSRQVEDALTRILDDTV